MKNKRLNIIYVIIETVISVVFSIFVIMLISATFKNIKTTKMVKDFMSKGVLEQKYGTDTEIYAVYTDQDIDDTIKFSLDGLYLGNTGDIFIMPESTVSGIGLFNSYMTYQFGGHAGVIGYDEDGKEFLIEAMGGTKEEAYVYKSTDPIDVDLYKPEERSVIGLRVKASTLEERKKAYEYALAQVGKKYNYLYIFDKEDKYYCTDLCTRAYQSIGYDIDKDGLYVACQDLLYFDNTYITFFKYIDPKTNIIKIYYLKKK